MKKLTKWESLFWENWLAFGLTQSDLTPRFCVEIHEDGERVSREFDFGSPSQRLLIEIDGLGGFDSRTRQERCGGHQTASGMRSDVRKRNGAIEAGWTVLTYPSSALDSVARLTEAVEQVARVMSRAVEVE